MANVTKRVLEVVEMLKGGKPLAFDAYVKQLNCKPITAMVYISDLRTFFGADIETIRDGRKVVSYRLINESDLMKTIDRNLAAKGASTKTVKAVKQPTKVKTAVVAKTVSKQTVDDGSVPVLDADMDINEISDMEFADLRSQLGL